MSLPTRHPGLFLFLAVLLASALASPVAAQRAECDPTPPRYRQHEYGEVLYALEASCGGTFTPQQQLFIGGLARGLLERCGVPRDARSRLKLANFLSSSEFVAVVGRNYSDPDLGNAVESQVSGGLIYAAGTAAVDAIDCEVQGPRLAKGILAYLEDTPDDYVSGCVDFYSGRYSRAQCQCIADLGRAVFPNIHAMPFSRGSIKSIINRNPFLGLQIAMQCRIGNY